MLGSRNTVELSFKNPHASLGLHSVSDTEACIRLWRPGASEVYFELAGQIVQAEPSTQPGIFEYSVAQRCGCKDYRIYLQDGSLAHDPYSFPMGLGELDLHLFAQGVHYELYELLGARCMEVQGVQGVRFVVWAPNAQAVFLLADFNHWDKRSHPMRSCGSTGLWELFVPGISAGQLYKFQVHGVDGKTYLKADPCARASELRPSTASRVTDGSPFAWNDSLWMEERNKDPQPMNIYELHLGSWRRAADGFLNYKEIAVRLADYCTDMGYTHVELLPVMEHPLDESWGYQVTGYYSVTSRFGTPADFKFLVNYLHLHGIGLILDWVPGHFPDDLHGLARFDGSALYEHADPKQGWHPHWKTHIFNYGRREVSNFLIANALFWLEEMHIDGLRVDAVASMLYLDYGREDGEWIPNHEGGNINVEAAEFLRHLNSIIKQRVPTAWMIAEESTAFPAVTRPVSEGGLGFDYKWNMGWMNDTLEYFATDALYRQYQHSRLTFGLLYAFSERYLLPLSHDEVVHGKKSLLSKMPGDSWQQMANLRLLYTYQICQPGKKLHFMSAELGQWNEWNCQQEIEWPLLRYPQHQGVQNCVRASNHFYRDCPALWEWDQRPDGFEWLSHHDAAQSLIAYIRRSSGQAVLVLHNFTPTPHAR
jgi:1,4-alpha-glucan branching enzyme